MILIILSLAIIAVGGVKEKPFVDRSECVGCADCVAQCPTGAISIIDGRASIDAELCIDCLFCVKTCTYRAIRSPK